MSFPGGYQGLSHFDIYSLEERVNKHKTYLVKNLKVFDLVLCPYLRNVITAEAEAEIMRLERESQVGQAAARFIEVLLASREPSKWHSFLEAIREPQHAIIVEILDKGETEELLTHSELQNRVEHFKKQIMEILDPSIMCHELLQAELLSGPEVEKIEACRKQEGPTQANFLLLLYVPRNKNWYSKFMKVLWYHGHCSLVRTIDPKLAEDLRSEEKFAIAPSFSAPEYVTSSGSGPVTPGISGNVMELRLGCGNFGQNAASVQTVSLVLSTPVSNSLDGSPLGFTTNSNPGNLAYGERLTRTPTVFNSPLCAPNQNTDIQRQPRLTNGGAPLNLNFSRSLSSTGPEMLPRYEPYLTPQPLGFTSRPLRQLTDNTNKELNRRMNEARSENAVPQDKYECSVCNQMFPSEIRAKQHEESKHGQKNVATHDIDQLNERASTLMTRTGADTMSRELKSGVSPLQGIQNEPTNSASQGKLEFSCTVCGKSYPDDAAMIQHRNSKHRDGNIGTQLSGQTPVRKISVNSQDRGENTTLKLPGIKNETENEKQKGKSEYPCSKCSKLFPTESAMVQHRDTKHGQGSVSTLEAKITVTSPSVKVQNKNTQLSSKPTASNIPENLKPEFPCTVCRKLFPSEAAMVQHRDGKHGDGNSGTQVPGQVAPPASVGINNRRENLVLPFPVIKEAPEIPKPKEKMLCYCSECSRPFQSEIAMMQHITASHPYRTARTQEVDATLTSAGAKMKKEGVQSLSPSTTCANIQQNLPQPEGKEFLCTVCKKLFPTEDAMVQHRRDKHGPKNSGK